MTRRRLDTELVRRGLARSRSQAQQLLSHGEVVVRGIAEPRPASLVEAGTPIEVSSGPRYASRGAYKLEAAISRFRIVVEGRRALDAGASTGGFTDLLLRLGAREVVAVDVGYGQLDHRLATDPRVAVHDRTNFRLVDPATLGDRFELAVADLSFISLCTVAHKLGELVVPGADLVVLVKPQFEVGPDRVGKGGVVRDPADRRWAVERVCGCLNGQGLGVQGVVASPITGSKGNQEFLVWARAGSEPTDLELPI